MKNPYFTVWLHPRSTIRNVLAHSPDRFGIYMVVAAWSVQQGFNRMINQQAGEHMGLPEILLWAVGGGLVAGVLMYLLMSWIFAIVGKWIGGQGSFAGVRKAAAWSFVPYTVVFVLTIILIIVFGHDLFRGDIPAMVASPGLSLLYEAVSWANFVLAVWALAIFLAGLAEVHRFSVWKAAGVVLMVSLFMLIAILTLTAFSVS